MASADTPAPADPTLTVELRLDAAYADGSPFSEACVRSFNMTRDEFHAMQKGVVGVLLDFGDQANQAAAAATASP